MAKPSSSPERGKIGKATLFLVICVILIAFLAPAKLLRGALFDERLATAKIAGLSVEHDINATATSWSKWLVDREKWHAGIRELDLPLVNRVRLASYLDERAEALAAMAEVGCYRLAGLWGWLMVALPLLFAVFLDAAMTRKARQHQFRYTSHTLQHTAGTLIGILIALLVAGLFIPYPLPYVMTAMVGIPLAWLSWSWIVSMPKRL